MEVLESRQQPNRFARRLFAPLPARYDRLAELLSFGQNGRWRAAMVDAVVAAAPRGVVLDVATGTGGVAIQLARRTRADIVGIDLTAEMLEVARDHVGTEGLTERIHLTVARGEELPVRDGAVDALTFTYLLRYVADPAATVAEMARVVKPGGVVANLEFAVPDGRLWQPLWWLYTRLVLPAAGFVAGGREWFTVGRFLGPSITEHYRQYPLPWHVRAWEAAGIEQVQVRRMSLGGGVVMWGRKAGTE